MATYTFNVKEVKRDGHIAWDAIDNASGTSIPIDTTGKIVAGSYPELSEHLKAAYGVDVILVYESRLGDELNANTWTYTRNGHLIVVHDIPRTIFRITRTGPS